MALGPTQRVFSAVKRLLGSLVANSETRLRLAVLELEEERARLLVLFLLAGASLLLLLLGVATLTALVIILFWDTYRITAIVVSAGALIFASLLFALIALRQAKSHTLLKETLKQLAADRALLEANQYDHPDQHR
ncbi:MULTISPECIES: phage holin family protein [unclassified Halomonas]|uniref:phage holin family protein n=1 Tax=unclassified Halomonas TaxID=2609666 RepID=UPI0021E48D45|nr:MULTISPECIES: phage holin family protein [unclassified Halomonas]UYG01052.1 phage holin family protein [Halomonas sp. GD1P12]WNL41202.1 phage holin family protein [Halomonas sp. PAMB 3264]